MLNNKFIKLPYEETLVIAKHFAELPTNDKLKGLIANKGKVQGKACISPQFNDQAKIDAVIAKMQKGDILIVQTTSPDIMILCEKAAAIVADQGGMLSHAAVISRELNIPCIIGTEYGTRIFKDGDLVEVDADKGIVRKI